MERAQQENRARTGPYSVRREYQLSGEDASKPESQVIAEVTYSPPSQKEYTIQKAEGGGQGEKVVRKVLDHESQAAGQPQLTDLSSANYEFGYLGTDAVDGHPCFVLSLKPRREAKELISGRAWVDRSSYMVRKVEGTPAKLPSWWIKELTVTLLYGDFEGLWLQYATQAVAQVRLAGRHVLTARNLDIRTATLEARAPENHSTRPRASRAGALVGAGVLVRR